MKKIIIAAMVLFVIAGCNTSKEQKWDTTVAPAVNGLQIPAGFENWAVIAVSHRIDRGSVRAILGNDIAVEAARSGNTNPYPDGAIIAKVAWEAKEDEAWPDAIVPGKFLIAEFMYKDSKKFAANGTGWGWARWIGPEHKPYGENKEFEQECIDCHSPVEEKDWVFTHGAPFK